MSQTSYVLIVGDDETQMMSYDRKEGTMRDIGLNFDNSPSVAIVYEVFNEDIKDLLDDVRSHGLKAGTYSTMEKAQRFMYKALSVSEDGTMGEPKVLTSWGGET